MERRVWGMVLLALGVMALLQGAGVFYFGLAFWPALLVLAGGALVRSSFNGWFFSWFLLGLGLWVGCIGLFEILCSAGATAIAAGDVLRFGWPFLLVALGVSILLGERAWFSGWRSRGTHPGSCRQWASSGGHKHHLGDLYHGRESWILGGDLDLQHGIGDFVLDLTTAEISEGRHRVTAKAHIGELLVRVPDNINIEVDASVSIGELQVLGESRSGLGGLRLRRKVLAEDSKTDLFIEARLGIGELVVQAPASFGGAR